MGSYTNPQQFYLIDGEELVNVDQDLNYNLARADERVRPLVEYQVTDEASISASTLPKETGFKWYKRNTNSIWVFRDDGFIYQDPNAWVDAWETSISFYNSYSSMNLGDDRIAYSAFNGFVHLRGKLVLNGGATDLPANTSVKFMEIPEQYLPIDARYATVYGGNASGGDFQMARIYIPPRAAADKRLEFCKYGGVATQETEKYLSLNDVFYSYTE
ncbi:hypothetical protein [Streptomyces rochei]|uniref:hypothetical protein n=1 Tax=Streptomyces rochei TaxID=1928 RepID=UPI0036A3F0CE